MCELGQSEAVLQQVGATKNFDISAEANKLLYLKSLNDIQYFIACFHKYDWLYHLATFLYETYYKGGQVTKSTILVKICYKLSYMIQVF